MGTESAVNGLRSCEERIVKTVTLSKGGYREKSIFNAPHRLVKTDTWNKEHKVVDIISIDIDKDGHSDEYAVDDDALNEYPPHSVVTENISYTAGFIRLPTNLSYISL